MCQKICRENVQKIINYCEIKLNTIFVKPWIKEKAYLSVRLIIKILTVAGKGDRFESDILHKT
jgi:hypothetical protein